MKRELTNRIRFVLEELVPPLLRDSGLFRRLTSIASRGDSDRFARFRQQAAFLSPADYAALYQDYRNIHSGTDNSQACIDRVLAEAIGPDICDIGCGSGAMLRDLAARAPVGTTLTGLDIAPPPVTEQGAVHIEAGEITSIPFGDRSFDTVICTHVLEHVLDIRLAISELRRITRRRLIIVVPQEREAIYNFNPHFHFFPYPHSFLRVMHPIPDRHDCALIGRDIYYREDRDGA